MDVGLASILLCAASSTESRLFSALLKHTEGPQSPQQVQATLTLLVQGVGVVRPGRGGHPGI